MLSAVFLALLIAQLSLTVAQFFDLGFRNDGRNRRRIAVLVERDENDVGAGDVLYIAGGHVFGFDPHADFHRRPVDVVHRRLERHEAADVNGIEKVEPIDACRDADPACMANSGSRAGLVRQLHDDAAVDVAHGVGLRWLDKRCKDRRRSGNWLAGCVWRLDFLAHDRAFGTQRRKSVAWDGAGPRSGLPYFCNFVSSLRYTNVTGGSPISAQVTDEALVALVLGGDANAFAPLVERHKRGIVNFIYASVRSVEDANDLGQDTFMRAYAHLRTFNPAIAKFSTWLYQIARNVARTHLGKESRRPQQEDLFEDETID